MKKMILLLLITTLASQSTRTHPLPGLGDYNVPFFQGGSYRPDIQSPTEFLGFELGGRSITHSEVMSYFTYLSETAPNAQLNVYAHSFGFYNSRHDSTEALSTSTSRVHSIAN